MPETGNGRLESWKEIAKYLGRDIRTVMRWEKERGLPVRRVPGGKRPTAVFAYLEELEAWRHAHSDNLLGNGEASQRSALRKPLIWVAVLVPLVAGGVLALVLTHANPPVQVRFAGNKLLAEDERGRLAWQHDLPLGADVAPDNDLDHPIRLLDVDGDGRTDALVAVRFCREPNCGAYEHELYCFSASGKLRWRYKPALSVQTPLRRYEGLWHFTNLLVSPPEASAKVAKTVWLAVAHKNLWPSFVARLGADGRSNVAFINPGVVYNLAHLQNASGLYLLAGGTNHDYNAGFLAVVKENQPTAVAPTLPGSSYECLNCPQGKPARYLIFPRTEMNAVYGLAPYNKVGSIQVLPSEVIVDTHELNGAEAIYTFTPDLEPRSVNVSAGYVQYHHRAERQHEVDHLLENCPELARPKLIREWTPEGGWRDIPVPWFGVRK